MNRTLSKLMVPDGAERVFAAFCGIDGLDVLAAYGLAAAQILVGLAIMAALCRTLSYGIGVLIHGTSTVPTLPHLILPLAEGSILLFWTSVPLLCAAIGLFLARLEHVAQKWEPVLSYSDMRNQWLRGRSVNANERDTP